MAVPLAAPASAASPAAKDDRYRSLGGQGLEAARAGDLSEAAALFRKALEIEPGAAETWNHLGVVLIRQGETTRGVEAFRRALRLKPGHAEGHRNLAVALDRQERSREAAQHYRAFLSHSPESDPAREAVNRRLAELDPARRSAR